MILTYIFLSSINYVYGKVCVQTVQYSDEYDIPYGSVVLESEGKSIDLLSLVSLEEEKAITVITIPDDESYVGVYDPQMYLYRTSWRYVDAEEFRYFSEDDYLNRRGVAVGFNACELGSKKLNGISDLSYEIINCIDQDMFLYPTLAVNATALSNVPIQKVILISENKQILNQLKTKFIDEGFEADKEKMMTNHLGLLTAIVNGFNFVYPRILIQLLFAQFLLFFFVVDTYCKKKSQGVALHWLVGATGVQSWFRTYFSDVVCSLVGSIIVTIVWLSLNSSYLFLSLFQVIEILVFIISIFCVISGVNVFVKLRKEGFV